MAVLRITLLLAALTPLQACMAPPEPVSVGRAAFVEHCSSCHGATGRGDGPMAVFVSTGVPDLRLLTARNGGTFPRAHVVRVVTRISDLHKDIKVMPDFGALLWAAPTTYTAPDGETIKTDATILAIADHLESVQD